MVAFLMSMSLLLGPLVTLSAKVRAESIPAVQAAEVDAAFFHRGEKVSYFFRGSQYFRLTGVNVDAGYPKSLPGEWKGLPASFHSGIDAAVQDPSSNDIFFFKGNSYSAINPATKTAIAGYDNVTLPGGWQGLPASFHGGIDAALDEGGSVILYKGNRQAVMTNYRFVSESAVPAGLLASGPLSAAFKYSNDRNYFFSGSKVVRAIGFNVEPGWLNEIRNVWIGVSGAQTTASTSPRDPFRPGDIRKIMAWISKETSNSRLDYCYKNTFGRGVGTPLTNCPAGTERNGLLCYPNCDSGYKGDGPLCRGVCPQGFNDIGLFCQKPTGYTRAGFEWQIGYPTLPQDGAFQAMMRACEKINGTGNCEISLSAAYPRCRAGYKGHLGDCSPICPAGWGDGTDCTKPSKDRPSTPMICAPGLQELAGLCYQNCPLGFRAAGPVCWQQCDTGAQNWECGGIGCSKGEGACATAITDMVLAPFNLVVGLFSMGLGNKIKAAADAAKQAANVAKGVTGGASTIKTGQMAASMFQDVPRWARLFESLKDLSKLAQAGGVALDLSNIGQGLRSEIELWTQTYEDNFAANTSKAIDDTIRNKFDLNTQRYIKRYYALHHLGSILEADGWRIGKLVVAVGTVGAGLAGDPGFMATINAYSQPMCPPVGGTPFPRVTLLTSGTVAPLSGTTWNPIAGDPIAGKLVQLSVASDGAAWGIDANDNIYQWTGRSQGYYSAASQWLGFPGKLRQISVGSDSFVVGVNASGEIYSKAPNGWSRIFARAPMKQVSIGSDGKLWGVDTSDNIYRWEDIFYMAGVGLPGDVLWGDRISQVDGKLRQISVGNADNVWGVNAANQIFRWDGRTWIQVPGVLKQVSVGSDGSVWGLNPNGEIFRWTGGTWERIQGGLDHISVADSGLVWGVNLNGVVLTRSF